MEVNQLEDWTVRGDFYPGSVGIAPSPVLNLSRSVEDIGLVKPGPQVRWSQ